MLKAKSSAVQSAGMVLNSPFGGDHEDFRGVEVQLDGVEEVERVGLRVVEYFLDGVEPFFQFVLAVGRGLAAFLVFPVCRKALFGHLVHARGADLHFDPLSGAAHESDVQGLVSVGLGVGEPVAEPFGGCGL